MEIAHLSERLGMFLVFFLLFFPLPSLLPSFFSLIPTAALAWWEARSSRSTSNSYSSVFKSALEGPDAKTNCDWIEVSRVANLASVSANSAISAWQLCHSALSGHPWPTRDQQEERFQAELVTGTKPSNLILLTCFFFY